MCFESVTVLAVECVRYSVKRVFHQKRVWECICLCELDGYTKRERGAEGKLEAMWITGLTDSPGSLTVD